MVLTKNVYNVDRETSTLPGPQIHAKPCELSSRINPSHVLFVVPKRIRIMPEIVDSEMSIGRAPGVQYNHLMS